MLKNFSFIIFITIFIVILSSCSEREDECGYFKNDSSPNFKLIWMDTTIRNGEYPEMQDTIIIHCGDNKTADNIIKNLNYWSKDWVNDTDAYYGDIDPSAVATFNRRWRLCPITFWVEIEKNKNKKVDSFIANVWVTDRNCEDYQKANITFYKYKETENAYVFTTQLIENGEYVAGRPIFLSGGINTTIYRDELILLDAAKSFLSVAEPIWQTLMQPKIRISVEINVNIDPAVKDTLKTFVYIFPVDN